MFRKTAGALRPDVLADVFELAELDRALWPAIDARIARSGHPTNRVAAADAKLEDRLARIEEAISEKRDERADALKARDAAKEAYAGTDNLGTDSDEFKQAEDAVRAVGELDDTIADLQAEQVSVLKMLGRSNRDLDDARRSNARRDVDRDPKADNWDSSPLFASDEVVEHLAKLATSKQRFGGIDLGQVIDRDAMAADVTGTANMRRGEYYGVLPQLFRPLRLLDLLPIGTMDGNSIPYTQESGNFDSGVAETAEGSAKPEAGVTYSDAEAAAKTIATWMKIRKQVLADVPALRGIIDGRLRYMVLRRLEKQVVAGDGTGENLEGILETSGIGSVPYAADELPADQVLRGLTTVLLADAEANGIVMNPLDWQDVLIAKASGDGHYYSGGPFSITPQVMWGVPLIPSPAIAQGTVLVGDFAIGAQLFIREGVNVLMSDSDQDDFIKNKATLLGEMRAALPVWRPAAFTTVDLQA